MKEDEWRCAAMIIARWREKLFCFFFPFVFSACFTATASGVQFRAFRPSNKNNTESAAATRKKNSSSSSRSSCQKQNAIYGLLQLLPRACAPSSAWVSSQILVSYCRAFLSFGCFSDWCNTVQNVMIQKEQRAELEKWGLLGGWVCVCLHPVHCRLLLLLSFLCKRRRAWYIHTLRDDADDVTSKLHGCSLWGPSEGVS